MHGLRVGVGGCRGSGIIRGARLFSKSRPRGSKVASFCRTPAPPAPPLTRRGKFHAANQRSGSPKWPNRYCEKPTSFLMIRVSSRISQLVSSTPAGVAVDRCDIRTRQLVTPELSNSLSIAKLLRCRPPLPTREVGQKRSAALGSLR